MPDEIRFIGDLERVQIKPDDVFVLTIPGEISADDEKRIRDELERRLPGHQVIVVAGGTTFSVAAKVNGQ